MPSDLTSMSSVSEVAGSFSKIPLIEKLLVDELVVAVVALVVSWCAGSGF